ncbi:MAG: 5-formyltetrahydrofolate cyclo-ligase [Rubrimonas sp.]
MTDRRHVDPAPTAADRKPALRAEALARRAEAQARIGPDAARAACAHLRDLIGAPGGPVAGYLAIRSEIDPAPAMTALHEDGVSVCVPVVVARGAALVFRIWRPGGALVRDGFGCAAPTDGAETTPRALIVPLLAFDRRGTRLGYGGGYYDRTLAALRAQGPVRAIGFAFAAQEVASLPADPHDAPLDAVVTETGPILFGKAG